MAVGNGRHRVRHDRGVPDAEPNHAAFFSRCSNSGRRAFGWAKTVARLKWYNVAKGFGFIVRDDGGKDVFVHVSALDRAGITGLNEGQRVIVGVAGGQKGPEAVSIRVGY